MSALINVDASRARQARLSKLIGPTGYNSLRVLAIIFALTALGLGIISGLGLGLIVLSPAILCLLPAIWYKRQLSVLPFATEDLNGRLSVDVLSRITNQTPQTPQAVWQAISSHWQASFFKNHLLLLDEIISPLLSTDEAELKPAMDIATDIANQNKSEIIELGFVVAGLLIASPTIKQQLVKLKVQPDDVGAVANWLARSLHEERDSNKNTGGIGRDWAFGFTPLLNRFGYNVSLEIEKHNAHFGALIDSEGVKAMESILSNKTGAVALIGPDGIGKTTSVHALAQRLIEGKSTNNLAYHQVINISATDITANARAQGDLEQIMLSLAGEAAHAGHIILFFDDAQLFFGGGPGSFDGTQILLSII